MRDKEQFKKRDMMILGYISAHEQATISDIMSLIKDTKHTAGRALDKLVKAGLIKKKKTRARMPETTGWRGHNAIVNVYEIAS